MAHPTVAALPDSDFAGLLRIPLLPLVADRNPFRQLEYIRRYVKALECSAILIEDQYIDRDYMQDHSAFYAASFEKYDSTCRRLHFFTGIATDKLISELEKTALMAGEGRIAYEAACEKLSAEKYLGFMVVKPLPGCCVPTRKIRQARTTSARLVPHANIPSTFSEWP